MSEKKFEEYPKSLHLEGDRNKAERIVKDAAEESAARAGGYRMIGEPEPKAEAKAKK